MKALKSKKETLDFRRRCIAYVRDFFNDHKFIEVETPALVKRPGMEPNLDPFKTSITISGKKQDAYLITSPEYHMKKLLAVDHEKIWQLTSAFRDSEEKSSYHSPEFKILEWYMSGTDYKDMAVITEELVKELVGKTSGDSHIYNECYINTDEFFERITCEEAFKIHANLSLRELYTNKKSFLQSAAIEGFEFRKNESTLDIFYKIFLQKIESQLGKEKPTFLFDYPAEMAALSKIKKNDLLFAERFELYIAGIEIANAFSELTDPKEQRERLEKEQKERKSLGKEVFEIDRTFIEALEYGIPSSSGIALGFDRLVMILSGAQSVREVQYFSEF